MNRRRRGQRSAPSSLAPAFDDFHEWVLSLPWVVERQHQLGTPGARSFGVECEPLGRSQLWLLTGLPGHLDCNELGLAVVVPPDAAKRIERARWGRRVTHMSDKHVLMTVNGARFRQRQDVESLVLTAYGYAMS